MACVWIGRSTGRAILRVDEGRRAFAERERRKGTGALRAAPGGNAAWLWRRLMKSLVEAIVRALVDLPDQVQIKEVIGEHAHVLELRVAKEDLGKVIGKGGAHASAIRTLMAAASGKEKKRYILEIIED